MDLYTFYLISCPDYPELIYVGSTTNLKERKRHHKYSCYNENSKDYNKKLYQFIRNNNIKFNEVVFETLDEFECDTFKTSLKWEQFFHDQFPNKLNTYRAYTDPKEWKKEYDELNKERIAEYNKEQGKIQINCDICGFLVSKVHIARHLKSDGCIKNGSPNPNQINCQICNRLTLKEHLKRHQKSRYCLNFVII